MDKKNKLFDSMINAFPFPLQLIDVKNYEVLMANSFAKKQNGNFLGKTCFQFSHKQNTPCDDKDNICPVDEVIRTKKSSVVEHTHYDKFGKPNYVEVHAYPILGDDGEVKEIIEASMDINERKNMEQEIIESYDTQNIISEILKYSLETNNMQELFDKTLDLVLSLKWLNIENKGAIFILENNVLNMISQKNLSEDLMYVQKWI
jgi:hypothetical protein